MKKISIIMPAYNTEKKIEHSIQSILKQTYTNFELIVINDGSQDNTELIVKELMNTDNRIKYYKIKNSGSAVARNIGLNNATGDYIAFVDSDDYIELNMLETMMLNTEPHSPDIISCSYRKISNNKIIPEVTYLREGYYDKKALEKEVYPYLFTDIGTNKKIPTSMWTKLFDRELIEKENIRFVPELRAGQDTIFTINCLLNADSFYYLPEEKLYNYVNNETSRTNTYMENGWDIYKSNSYQLKLLSDRHSYHFLKEQLPYNLLQNSKTALVNVTLNSNSNHKTKIKEFEKIVTDSVLQEAILNIDKSYVDWKNNVFIKLIKNQNIYLIYLATLIYTKS